MEIAEILLCCGVILLCYGTILVNDLTDWYAYWLIVCRNGVYMACSCLVWHV